MTRWTRAAITAAVLALAPATGQARGTVVLTYDDALPSQLDHALPALNAAGLKATFFLSAVHAAAYRAGGPSRRPGMN